jgi:hypothetical protein
VLAAFARLLHTRRRRGVLITPDTILHGHRNLAPPLDHPARRPRPPAIPAGVGALNVRLVAENPHWSRIPTGASARPPRARRTRLQTRRLHRMEDSHRRGHRSRTAAAGPTWPTVPPRASPSDPCNATCFTSTPSGSVRSVRRRRPTPLRSRSAPAEQSGPTPESDPRRPGTNRLQQLRHGRPGQRHRRSPLQCVLAVHTEDPADDPQPHRATPQITSTPPRHGTQTAAGLFGRAPTSSVPGADQPTAS